VFSQISNKIGAFLYRLEYLRNNSFGTIGVYGNEPNLQVFGLFVWRGNGIPGEMFNNEAFNCFQKTRVYPDQAKKLVSEYWGQISGEHRVEGFEAREVKVWK
jgi:hypothetical protein